jgi:hypothetical protein
MTSWPDCYCQEVDRHQSRHVYAHHRVAVISKQLQTHGADSNIFKAALIGFGLSSPAATARG